MLKNNYRKIGKKKGNDVDANVAQHEYSNINAIDWWVNGSIMFYIQGFSSLMTYKL